MVRVMFWLSEDNETLWSENRTQWEEQGWNFDASYELVIFILEILEKNYNLDKCFSQLCDMIYTS